MTRPLRVLIADDQPVSCEYLAGLFSESGFEVDEAFDGAAALQKIENEHYDVILLDLIMPKLSGFEVAQKVNRKKSSDPAPTWIAMSGYFDDQLQKDCLSCGFELTLTKPVSSDKIRILASNLREGLLAKLQPDIIKLRPLRGYPINRAKLTQYLSMPTISQNHLAASLLAKFRGVGSSLLSQLLESQSANARIEKVSTLDEFAALAREVGADHLAKLVEELNQTVASSDCDFSASLAAVAQEWLAVEADVDDLLESLQVAS